MDVDALAARLDRSASTIRRIEAEESEPSVAQINVLVSVLPLSAEALLKAMGVHLNPPEAAKLPPRLVEAALQLTPARLVQLEETALGLLLVQQGATPPPR